jgi:hypothetical protein
MDANCLKVRRRRDEVRVVVVVVEIVVALNRPDIDRR